MALPDLSSNVSDLNLQLLRFENVGNELVSFTAPAGLCFVLRGPCPHRSNPMVTLVKKKTGICHHFRTGCSKHKQPTRQNPFILFSKGVQAIRLLPALPASTGGPGLVPLDPGEL